jgi:hypothetical protein
MSAAAECNTGTETLDSTDATTVASFSEHPDCMTKREERALNPGHQARVWPVTYFAKWEQNSLEPSSGLVKTLLESLVQLDIQPSSFTTLGFFLIRNVISDLIQQDTLQEHLHFCRLQV